MKTLTNIGACLILQGLLSTFVAAQETATLRNDIRLESDNSVVICSEIEGTNPIEMSLPEGTEVEEGDLIVQFDDTEWIARIEEQQVVLQMKIAEAAQVESTLRARRELAGYELKVVEQALVVAQLKQESFQADGGEFALALLKAEAEVMVASERLELSSENFELARAQHEAALCDLTEVNAARLAVKESEAMLTVAKATLEHLREHVRPLREAELKLELYQSEAAVSGTKIQLESIAEELEATEASVETAVQREEAKLEELQTQLEKCCIYAPMSGRVTRHPYKVYAIYRAGDQRACYQEGAPLMQISDQAQLQARFAATNTSLPSVGQEVRIHIDAFADQEFVGVVGEINPFSLDESFLSVNIDNPNDMLRSGMTGTVEFDVSTEE